jgi:hypothetical protein
VYRTLAEEEPDEAGVWLGQLEDWLVEVRQRLVQARRRDRQAEAN